MPETATMTPEVLWAQRSSSTDPEKNFIYLTLAVPDVAPSELKLDIQPKTLTFAGHSGTLKRDYQVKLDFYAEIDEKETKVNHTTKSIELVLRKKELKEEFWPRLLEGTQKMHYVKTDFDKWVDEDEQEGAPDDDMGAMGGAGMGGMPGMGDMSSMMGGGAGGDFGGLDFSKLGNPDAAAGTDMGDMDDEDDDDEEMPQLEDKDEPVEESSSKAKIEEVE